MYTYFEVSFRMPITPLHTAVAYLLNRWRKELSLPALIVGSMVPDLEIPFVYLASNGFHDRLVLHSLLGAAFLGTSVAVLLTVFVYPLVISSVFGLDKNGLKEKCHFSAMLVVCCFVGTLSHVLIDSLHHNYNPLLFPFMLESFDAFVLKNPYVSPTDLVSIPMLAILVLVLIWEIRRGLNGFWKRIFV